MNQTRSRLNLILQAIEKAGFARKDIMIALDPAASEFYDKRYKEICLSRSDKSERDSAGWSISGPISSGSIRSYPEDGLAEDDWDGFKLMTQKLI